MALPDEEKIFIIKQLRDSINMEVIDNAEVDQEELAFVQECLEEHQKNPGD